MHIDPDSIAAVQAVVQIEEVIGDFISLKRKGQNYWGLCPFHHEKSPSFSVAGNKGFYKCFGCDAKGDAISFLMAHQGMSYVESMQHLAAKYGITLASAQPKSKEEQEAVRQQDGRYLLMALAQTYYQEALAGPKGEVARNYLAARGLDEVVCKNFGLGYSPSGWRNFHDHAVSKGYTLAQLEQVGLVIVKEEDKVYDRFRARLTFPIHNVAGKVVAFTARRLNQDDSSPKYVNSPETPLFTKGNHLYGLYQAKQAIKASDSCYIVEGNTDVLAMQQAGVKQVVATSGTAFSTAQAMLLGRYTKQVILLFDGDKAGVAAALRSVEMLLTHGFDLKVVMLPEGEDPDSYRKGQGSAAFQAYLETHQQDAITFQVQHLLRLAGDSPGARAKVIEEVVATLALMEDSIKRAVYLQVASGLLSVGEEVLKDALYQRLCRSATLTQAKQRRPPKIGNLQGIVRQERTMLYLLLHHASFPLSQDVLLGNYLFEELSEVTFTHQLYNDIYVRFKKAWEGSSPRSLTTFLQELPEELKQKTIEIMATPYTESSGWMERGSNEFPDKGEVLGQLIFKNVLRMKLGIVKRMIADVLTNLNHKGTMDEEELLLTYQFLQQAAQEIAGKLGIVIYAVR